jgi:uncharacterized protein YndB with AHSA1/START domain
METVVITRVIKAPIERVFDVVTDHANYAEFPGVKMSRLVREGQPHRNGVGAVREIESGGSWFQEEITLFDPPHRLEYRIVAARPHVEHRGGSMVLASTAGGTTVTWSSTFHVPWPVIGGVVTWLFAPFIGRAFGAMLDDVERRIGLLDVAAAGSLHHAG